jgi:RPA family protein
MEGELAIPKFIDEVVEGETKDSEDNDEKKKKIRLFPSGVKAKRLTTASMLKQSLKKNSKKKWKPRNFMK